MFSRFYKILDYKSEPSLLKSKISQPIRLQPYRLPHKLPHPDPQTRRKQHNPQPTTMEISKRETHRSGSYTSTSKKKTSLMARKSRLPYPIYKEETPQYGEIGRHRNSLTGRQQSPTDRIHHLSSKISSTSSSSSKPASATPILREQCRGSWQELAWEKKLLNSMSMTSDSIRHRVDTTTYASSSFSAMDSQHGFKPESAFLTLHSPCSSNGKKKQSSLTDKRGWTKQSNKTSWIDKETDKPLDWTPRWLQTDHPPQSTCHAPSHHESTTPPFAQCHLTTSPCNQSLEPQDPWT